MANSNKKPPSKFADDSTSLFPPHRRVDLSTAILGTRKTKSFETTEDIASELVCILAAVGAVTLGSIIIYFLLRILSWIATH